MEENCSKEKINIQWFPGHMSKARRLIAENLKLVDVVVELLDARIPYSSANPLINEIVAGKPRLVVLNKSDLADARVTQQWIEYFRAKGIAAVAVDSVTGKGTKQLVSLAAMLAKDKTERLVQKGGKARAARIMVLGIPNVGKSSLINRLAGVHKAKAENRPGVTRSKQWVRIGKDLELLDMPGILWPKFEDPVVGLRLAFTGAISDDVYDMEQVVLKLAGVLCTSYPDRLCERYQLAQEDLPADGNGLLTLLGRKRGCLLRGGIGDMEKAQRVLLTEFRSGKMGRISLDLPLEFAASGKEA